MSDEEAWYTFVIPVNPKGVQGVEVTGPLQLHRPHVVHRGIVLLEQIWAP